MYLQWQEKGATTTDKLNVLKSVTLTRTVTNIHGFEHTHKTFRVVVASGKG